MEKEKQYERVFKHFDSNGDGKISPAELRQCLGSIGGSMMMTEAEAEAAVLLMDSDGDGLLCLEDFVRIVEGGGEEEKAKDLKEAFSLYEDHEKQGITPKSLRRMLSRLGLGERRSVDDCKNIISHLDLNGDGVLNFDEFKYMMSSH